MCAPVVGPFGSSRRPSGVMIASMSVSGFWECGAKVGDENYDLLYQRRLMSRFATVNLLKIEDSVGDRAPGIEGRFARKHLDSRDLGVSLFRYAANVRSPMAHSHREQEEAYIVVAGSGRVLLDDEAHELQQWDVVRVAPEVVRSFEAGPDGLDIVAVGGPKPEDGDGVMGTAVWPDAR